MLLFEQIVVRSEQNAVNCLLAVAVHDLAEDGEDAGAFERVLRARVGDQKTNKAENQVRLGVDPLDLFFKAPDVVSSVSDDVGLEKSRVEVRRFVDVFGEPGALLLEGVVHSSAVDVLERSNMGGFIALGNHF